MQPIIEAQEASRMRPEGKRRISTHRNLVEHIVSGTTKAGTSVSRTVGRFHTEPPQSRDLSKRSFDGTRNISPKRHFHTGTTDPIAPPPLQPRCGIMSPTHKSDLGAAAVLRGIAVRKVNHSSLDFSKMYTGECTPSRPSGRRPLSPPPKVTGNVRSVLDQSQKTMPSVTRRPPSPMQQSRPDTRRVFSGEAPRAATPPPRTASTRSVSPTLKSTAWDIVTGTQPKDKVPARPLCFAPTKAFVAPKLEPKYSGPTHRHPKSIPLNSAVFAKPLDAPAKRDGVCLYDYHFKTAEKKRDSCLIDRSSARRRSNSVDTAASRNIITGAGNLNVASSGRRHCPQPESVFIQPHTSRRRSISVTDGQRNGGSLNGSFGAPPSPNHSAPVPTQKSR